MHFGYVYGRILLSVFLVQSLQSFKSLLSFSGRKEKKIESFQYRILSSTSKVYSSTQSATPSSSSAQGTGQVFVCTNTYCREKGSDATMATFTFLTPPSVPVMGVNCLGRCNKGPNIRILTQEGTYVEVSISKFFLCLKLFSQNQ